MAHVRMHRTIVVDLKLSIARGMVAGEDRTFHVDANHCHCRRVFIPDAIGAA
jgi:hypothetical protein